MKNTIKTPVKKRNCLNNKAFSLVELLVVVTIIAILSATAYIALGGQTVKARNAKRIQDLDTIQSALEMYALSNNDKYPTALNELVTAKSISKIPVDPSSNSATTYNYEYAVNSASSPKFYQLAATLEEEVGYKAYIVGNGEDLIDGGDPVNSATGECEDDNNQDNIADESTTSVPYCI